MVKTIFVEAEWEGDILLGKEVLEHLDGKKSVALFASVQFLKLDQVKKQLADVKTTQAKRAGKEIQILGCDIYPDSLNIEADAVLYIGDGLFHPKALLFSHKEVIIWNPIANKMSIITQDNIMQQIKKIQANLKRFIAANTIGILVSVKPGQQYLSEARKLKKSLEKEGKKAFIFIDDSFDLNQLDNFPFIEAWVNTACPRIGTDDIINIEKPFVNIREAFDPVKFL